MPREIEEFVFVWSLRVHPLSTEHSLCACFRRAVERILQCRDSMTRIFQGLTCHDRLPILHAMQQV